MTSVKDRVRGGSIRQHVLCATLAGVTALGCASTVRRLQHYPSCPDGAGPASTQSGDGLGCYRTAEPDEGEPHGPFVTFYDDGRPEAEGNFDSGNLDGEFKLYWPNGKLRAQLHFKGAKKHGAYASWGPEGNPRATGGYRHGLMHGEWRVSEDGSVWVAGTFEGGKQQGRFVYYENGKLLLEEWYDDGVRRPAR